MKSFLIENVTAYRAIECHGGPALRVEVSLSNGTSGSAIGVLLGTEIETALKTVNEKIAGELVGEDARLQTRIDSLLKDLDGTRDLSHLRPEILFTISMAVCKVAAASVGLAPYRYLGGLRSAFLPRPIFAMEWTTRNNNHEILIIPSRHSTLTEGIEKCRQVFEKLVPLISETSRGSDTEKRLQKMIEQIRDSNEYCGIGVALDQTNPTDETGNGESKRILNSLPSLSFDESCVFALEKTSLISDIFNAAARYAGRIHVVEPFNKFHGLETLAADIPVALGAEYIKLESFSSYLTICQLNCLLRLEDEFDIHLKL